METEIRRLERLKTDKEHTISRIKDTFKTKEQRAYFKANGHPEITELRKQIEEIKVRLTELKQKASDPLGIRQVEGLYSPYHTIDEMLARLRGE